MKRFLSAFAATLAVLFALYLLRGVYLHIFQRELLYAPPSGMVEAPAAYGGKHIQEVQVTTADGLRLRAWFAKPSSGNLVVLFFHGNGYNLPGAATVMPAYLKHGYGVYLCEYRGYSGNPGKPSEPGLYMDARGCLKSLRDLGYGPKQIILYGASLGTGVATQMATEGEFAALVLESPFTDLVDLDWQAFRLYPPKLIWRDRFSSIDKIGNIKIPLLIIHGEMDNLVPFDLGKRLYAAANEPKKIIVIPKAGHNDLYEFGAGETIAAWLDTQVKTEARK